MNVISRTDLQSWLDSIAAGQTLIAPVDTEGRLLYRPVPDSAHITWNADLPVNAAKEYLFPPTERLLTIERNGKQGLELREHVPQGQQTIFGIRPCDAQGILALDALFLDEEPVDTTYQSRRAQTTLIGWACQEMKDTCFCTALGGSPHDTRGLDIMLTQVDGDYVLQILTEKGEKLVQDLDMSPFQGTLPDPPTPLQEAPDPREITWQDQWSHPVWEEMSQRCLGCRMCAYVCPACRCFDVRDELLEERDHFQKFERIRAWDSCMRQDYRTTAGDHNPRKEKMTRLRNRVFCKFHYFPQQYGPMACTGCGRCIEVCPVNIDMVEILSSLAQGVQV